MKSYLQRLQLSVVLSAPLEHTTSRIDAEAHGSVVKTRMSPEERRELMRAQREVMWNLQKDYVVTIVSPGDDPVPYKRQGNPDVNTPLSVKKRHALRKKPLIQVPCYA